MKKLTTIREVIDNDLNGTIRPLLKNTVFTDYLKLTVDSEKIIKEIVGEEIYKEKIAPVTIKEFQYVCNNFVNLATYINPDKDGNYQSEY